MFVRQVSLTQTVRGGFSDLGSPGKLCLSLFSLLLLAVVEEVHKTVSQVKLITINSKTIKTAQLKYCKSPAFNCTMSQNSNIIQYCSYLNIILNL